MDDLKEEICDLLFQKSDCGEKRLSTQYQLHEREFDNVTEEILCKMEEYAKQKCIEQKRICAEYAWEKWDPNEYRNISESVLNAPLATDK